MRRNLLLGLALVAHLAACPQTEVTPLVDDDFDGGLPDGATKPDASQPAEAGGAVDAGRDAAATPDATVDAAVDLDAGVDAPADGSVDLDAAVDAGADGSVDLDAAVDAGASDAALIDDSAASADAAPGTLTTSATAATQLDLIGPGDIALTPNGQNDGTISAHAVGPITGFILVTTNAAGTPAGGQQWDTITGSETLPNIGSGFNGAGSATWILGVFEGTTMLNDVNGNVSLTAGAHSLTLVAAPSGYFTAGQYFRLYARGPGGAWTGGPVFLWP
ncbi:MAG: hypothetical protein IPG50_07925 [Myxococcales bacterium]|nr:hypothetical protein [Myxococcales bacterium]